MTRQRGIVGLKARVGPRLSGHWCTVTIACGVFLLARILSAILMNSISRQLPSTPSYLTIASNWDGQWYKSIALHGYRTDPALFEPIPQQNEVAFYPGFPMFCRTLMNGLGISFEVASVSVSLACGALAAVLLYSWLLKSQPRWAATAALSTLCMFPSSPSLQIAYTEGVAMLFLVVCLRALEEGRYAVLSMGLLALAFTRPIVPPLALLIAIHVWLRWRAMSPEDRNWRSLLAPSASLAVALIGCVAWPITVWWMTGIPRAYFSTAGTWVRFGGLKGGWIAGTWQGGQPILAVLMAVILLLLVAIRIQNASSRPRSSALVQWGSFYALFILATTTISTSIFRYALLLLAPVNWTRASQGVDTRKRWVLFVIVMVVEFALQYLWLKSFLVLERSPNPQSPP